MCRYRKGAYNAVWPGTGRLVTLGGERYSGPRCPPVLDCSPHSMEESGEPSPLFFGLHSPNHKIRWNQEFPIRRNVCL